MSEIRLIVGLGNPGREYQDTRHNAGFWWVDALAHSLQTSFKADSKFQGLITRTSLSGQELWLLKPQTFMNRSGQSVGALAQFYKIEAAQILVVHDELDLLAGTAKLKLGGGHGGHNGLKDITAQLATPAFWRLRLGIGHPGDRNEVSHFVLNAPRREEQDLIESAIQRALQVAPLIVAGKQEAAMLTLHSAHPRPAESR
jgi:peptidyl-tRNA hydrolase, PTH1 family